MDGFMTLKQCVIVPDWNAFVEWVTDGGGYDQSYFDVRDSRCLALQEDYLAYLAEMEGGRIILKSKTGNPLGGRDALAFAGMIVNACCQLIEASPSVSRVIDKRMFRV